MGSVQRDVGLSNVKVVEEMGINQSPAGLEINPVIQAADEMMSMSNDCVDNPKT